MVEWSMWNARNSWTKRILFVDGVKVIWKQIHFYLKLNLFWNKNFSYRNGFPSARFVLMKNVEENGITFFTNYGSRKAQEIVWTNFSTNVWVDFMIIDFSHCRKQIQMLLWHSIGCHFVVKCVLKVLLRR